VRATLLVLALTAAAPLRGQDLSLSNAVTRALRGSDAIAIAKAGVTRAKGQVTQAESNLFPQLAGNADYTRTIATQYTALLRAPTIGQTFASVGFGALNTFQLGLTFSQTIFNGQFFAAAGAASVPGEAAQIELTAARAQVVYDVAQAYYDASLADELATIADSTMAQDDRTLAEARVGQRVGAQSEFDLLQSQVTRDNQMPVVLQSHNSRSLAYARLAQLLKLPLDTPLHLTTTVDSAADLPGGVHLPALADTSVAGDTATARRSSVREQALAVREFEALLSQNRAGYLPTLTLFSGYQRVAYPMNGLPPWNTFLDNWNVTIGASVPIFNGFKTHGDVLVAQANVAEQRARLQQARDAAALDARSTVGNLGEAAAGWVATAGSVDEAGRACQIAEVRYRSGLSTLVELTASRLALQQALANRAQAARNLQVARVRAALIQDLPLSGNATPPSQPMAPQAPPPSPQPPPPSLAPWQVAP
jgi:outer membrane protein